MKQCPFCNSNETWVFSLGKDAEMPSGEKASYAITCSICHAEGPPSKTKEMAIKKWDGLLINLSDDELMGTVNEDVGGVSAPMATTVNTPGMGSAVPAASAGLNTDGPSGSGDSWSDASIGTQTNENNINPYDKIGNMMAKKMGVKPPFKKKDSKTNTILQDFKNKNESFNIETLDDYQKASKHVPDHPLTSIKKKKSDTVNETSLRDDIALKDVKAKDALDGLGISYEFKPGKSGIDRVFITDTIPNVLEKIEKSGWEKYGKNPDNTIRKYSKGDQILTIYAEGKQLPRATLTSKENVTESYKTRLISNSITPYLKHDK